MAFKKKSMRSPMKKYSGHGTYPIKPGGSHI